MGPAPALIILHVEAQNVPVQMFLPDPLFQQKKHVVFRTVFFHFHRVLIILPGFVRHAVIPFPVVYFLQPFRQGRECIRILHDEPGVIGDDTDLPLRRLIFLFLLLHPDLGKIARGSSFRNAGPHTAKSQNHRKQRYHKPFHFITPPITCKGKMPGSRSVKRPAIS